MNLWQLIATVFYIGKLPIAPGTWGSLFTLIIYIFIPQSLFIQISIIIFILFLSIISSYKYSNYLEQKDPSEIVIDEILCMSISLFMLPQNILLYTISFILFRMLDIYKPSIIYDIQDQPYGIGIVLDDAIAGIFTCLICHGINSII